MIPQKSESDSEVRVENKWIKPRALYHLRPDARGDIRYAEINPMDTDRGAETKSDGGIVRSGSNRDITFPLRWEFGGSILTMQVTWTSPPTWRFKDLCDGYVAEFQVQDDHAGATLLLRHPISPGLQEKVWMPALKAPASARASGAVGQLPADSASGRLKIATTR